MTGTLHILGQGAWHDPAFIVGDKAALVALRHALDVAICDGVASADEFVSDGEGYTVRVYCRADMGDVPLPYVDPMAADEGAWPEWLE